MNNVINNLKKKFNNNKKLSLNMIGIIIIRILIMITSYISLPLYINFFVDENILGLWYTILSIFTLILLFDFGIGNSLRNSLVPIFEEKDYECAKKYISTSYILVIGITFVFFLVGFIVIDKINWNDVFNISDNVISSSDLLKVVKIMFYGILLQMLFKNILSILYALQNSFLPNLLNLLINVCQLIYVLFINRSIGGNGLVEFSLVYVLSNILYLIIISLIVFKKRLKTCLPNYKYFNIDLSKKILLVGFSFFFVQIASSLLNSTNEFLISYYYTPENVVEYQIYNKVFLIIGTFYYLLLIPVWSAVTDAKAKRKYSWLKKLCNILKFSILFACILQFLIIIILQILFNIWLGDNSIAVNYFYAFVFAISGSIFIINSYVTTIANGLGKLKTQLIYYSIALILRLPITYLANLLCDSWIAVIVSYVILMIPFVIIQNKVIDKEINILNKEENNDRENRENN